MNRSRKTLTLLFAGVCLMGVGNCFPRNFWFTQWDSALTAMFETVVTNPLVDTIDNALAPATD